MADDNKDLGEFAQFVPGAKPDLGEFAQFMPKEKPRGALGEIGNQLKAGVLSDLPKMAGQAIQWTSDPGHKVYEIGKSIADYGREQGERADLQPQESQHNVVTNTLAAGARMIPQSIVPAAGVGLAATGVGAGAGAALLAGSVLGAAPAGMAQAQDTLEKARAKGISDDVGLPAARKTGAIEWGGETIGNYLGGKLFGIAGRAIGKPAGTAAEQALEAATNTQVLKPWLRQLPETVIGEVGTEMGQNAGEAYVEKQAGIDNHAPWDAAKEAVLPTIGMTALLAPFGLAGMGVNAHRQQQRNDVLTSPDADQNARTRIAAEIAPELEKVDRQAAANFRANAARAISTNQALTLDASLFADPSATPAAPPGSTTQPGIDPLDAPDAGTDMAAPPAGPLAAAARLANPMLPMRQEGAQKQAEERTRTTGIPHEVVPHPSAPGMFGVRAVQDPALEQGAAAPAAEAAPLEATAPATPATPVGLQVGEPVQLTINGQDQFENGTRVLSLSADGQFAQVEGLPMPVPVANLTRIDPAAAAAIDAGAHQAATSPQNERLEPTDAQKEAGNYKKGPITYQGLDLSIENPVGSTRKGVDRDGTPWETTMAHHYGYIRGTNGADNEHIDAYVGPNPASHHVFVVDQVDPQTGAWDEHKVMLGFNSEEQARKAYDQHYAPDWKGGANMTATTIDGFKEWMKGDTTEPFNPAAFEHDDLFDAQQAAPLSHDDKVESDPFYPAALDALRGKTSVKAEDLQTQLNVGFNRASRLLEQMQQEGYVSPISTDGQRTVTQKLAQQQPAQPAAPVQDDAQRKAAVQQAVYQVLGTTSPFGAAPMDPEDLDLHLEAMQHDLERGKFSFDRFAQSDVGRHLGTGELTLLKPHLDADPAGTLQALRNRIVERSGQPQQQAPAAPAPAQDAPLTEDELHAAFDQAEAEVAQEQGAPAPAAQSIDDLTRPISYADARALIAGKTEKPGGVDPARQIDAGEGNQSTYRLGEVPLSMFKENEAGDLYDGTVNRDRAVEYSQRDPKGAPPVVAVVSPTTGKLNILDGGHRLTAARMRGDATIPTLISQKAAAPQGQQPSGAYERYKEILARGAGTTKLVDEIRRSDELTDEQVRELVALPKIDQAAEEKSRANSAAFGERAASVLSTLKGLKTPADAVAAKQALTKLADDMDAVNDRFRNLVRKAADEVLAVVPNNLGHANESERQAAGRVKNTLEGVANFGKNVTAPEHAANEFKELDPNNRFAPSGPPENAKSQAEIDERVIPLTMDPNDFKEVTDEWAELFAAPGEKVVTEQRAKQAGVMSQQEADAQLAKWKAHVAKQGEEHRGENFQRTILSLFDLSGEWSKPWLEAGYNVVTFDIQTGQDVNDFSVEYFTENYDLTDVYGILAAAPCTDFTHAASRLWAVKDADGRTEASKELVLQTLRTIEYFRPKFWALENPSGGRIEKTTGLPPPRLSFQPHHFGNPETKPTALFGKFNPELPLANVAPLGSKTDKVGGKSIETKNERSQTPEGFAYAFFMANNYIDQTPEQRLAADFPELSGAVKGALKAGMSEEAIREVVTDTYEDGDPDAARDELVQAVADHVKENGAPAKPAAVDYPNRRLGFQKARTDEADAYNDHAWANIAAANMKVGDTFKLNGKQQTVESISDKTLKLKDADGKVRTLNPDGVAWDQFKRDLGGQIGAENLQAKNIMKPARPLIDIFKRDPAVHVDSNGSVYLRDGGPVPAAQQEEAKADPHETARRAKLDEDKAEFAWDMVEQASQKLTDDADVERLQPLADEYKGAAAEHRKAKEAALKQLDEKGRKAFEQEQKARDGKITAEVAKTADAVQAKIDEALGRKPADPIPEEINALFRVGSANGIHGPLEEKQVRTLMAWGYDASNMPTNMFGRPGENLTGTEVALQAGSPKKIALLVWTAQAPNGKWGVYAGYKTPDGGSHEGVHATSPQFDTRYDAVAEGMQNLRDRLPALKEKHPELAGYIDMSFGKMEQEFAAMKPAEAPATTEPASAEVQADTETEAKPGKVRSFTEDEKRAIAGISLGTGTQVNRELELGLGNFIRPNTIDAVRKKLLAMDPDKVRPYIDHRVREYERERAEKEPVVQKQQKIHVYDEKEAKPLLIIACTEEKLPGRHAVIDLYQGAMFDVLRKWLPKGAIDVYVLSAKYGLVRAEAVLQSYDEKMTAARQKELIAEGVVPSDFKGKNFSDVYIAGGQLYAPVAQVYAEQLRAAGFVGPNAEVKGTVGFIGQQRGQLGEYLRTVHERLGTLPAKPAPLEVGVRVRIKRLAKSPATGVSLKDANRFAGRIGTVEREMVVGDSRYFIVNLDDAPEKVERQQEFHSNFLDVLTPAEQAGQAAPGELSQDPEKRKAQILERIDAALGKNAQLVAQADLFKTGNRFQDFRDEYKAAFDKVLVDMFNDKAIEARDVQMFTASFKDLPGYADRLARHFIDDHHGAENGEVSSLADKWGLSKEDTPKDGYFPNPETALKFDNKRTGKEQFSFEIQVAQAPNGRWAVSSGYQQGGQTGNATGIGMFPPALTSEAHRSRMLAIEAGGEAIRQHLAANGKESLRTTGNILTAITKLKLLGELREKAAALAARAEAAGAQKLAGQIREIGRDMQPDDANLTRKRVDETIAGREKLVRAAEKRAEKKAAEKAAKAEPKAEVKPEPAAPEAPAPQKDAPGTRRFPQSVRTSTAERLQKVLDGFTADRNTREGSARMIMRSMIEELGKEKTVIDVADQLREASSRLFRQFKMQAEVLDEIADQLDEAENAPEQAQPETDGALAGSRPMSPKQFETDLKNHGNIRFGDATFAVKPAGRGGFGLIQADTYIVEASYPHSNKQIGFQQNLSLQQAVEAARLDAFDWWDNRRVKEAEFARKREKLVRAGQRELYGVFSKDPAMVKAAADAAMQADFSSKATVAVRDWVEKEKAAGELDPDRKLMLDNLVIGQKVTLPKEWFDSLYKYLKRAAKRAEKELDRDPAVYQAELIRSAQLVGLPPESVGVFKLGFDHALAGKTKSTLPPSTMMAQGYDAGSAWMKTDEGQAWFTGRRGKKLENTGADLRRWFDESKRKIKEVTADNMAASYDIIKGQASRVEAFANVAGANATPGTKRYITAIRDEIKPFQEWLLDKGPLAHLYGEVGYRESDSFKIARFLDGRAYAMTYDTNGKRVSMEDATAQERLELLQDAAATYNARLQGLAEAMSGATSINEAAQRFQDYMVKDKDAPVWSSTRLTEAGKEVDGMMRGHAHYFEPGYREVNDLLKNENDPDGPSNRKQALMVPKLDHVVREGETLQDYRKGENVTPQRMKETFGFADVGFGKWVGAKQDQDHLNYAYDAFMDLAKLLGIDPKHIGLGGSLHFTIGALGHGRHAAHFQARQPHPNGGTVPVINVTNTKGDGTVAHEWFHALDHALNQGWSGTTWVQHEAVQRLVNLLSTSRDIEALAKKLPLAVRGESFMRYGRRNTPIHNLKTEAGLIENAEAVLRYDAGRQGGRPTDYKKNADVMGEDYWGNPKELLARAAEAWVHDTLGGTSNYLVNPAWVGEGKVKAPQYKGAPYPMGEERKLFNDAIGALVKALRFDGKGVTLDKDSFDKEFPDLDRQFKEAYESLKAQIPSMVRAHLAEKEARKVAQQHAKNEAERARQAEALAAQQAQEQAERDAKAARLRAALEDDAQQPAEPPAGPLSEGDLEALFDQAESELAEEQQEQPEAKDPGEPAKADHWTREDIDFLIKSYDAGSVFLLADPSLGLPTIHDMPSNATRHMGFGTFVTKTDRYEALWDGGGEMKQTPGGKSYTLVSIKDGRGNLLKDLDWDNAKTKLQARLIVKTGPKAAPTLSAEQEKSAAQLIGEAAKLGVSGVEEAMKGLIQLFGGNALKSFPAGFDEESYKAAKPHFQKALVQFQAAGKTLVDLFKMLISHFGPGIRPYAIQFAKEQGLSANLAAPGSATEKIAQQVQKSLAAGETISSKTLFEHADKAFGGTQAEGKYSVKDAYDAMEAGMNRHIMAQGITPDGAATDAGHKIEELDKWTQQLATQTRRTEEMDEYQQFSTPPSEAFAAAWLANIRPGEVVLEPSAGTGSLAIYANLAGASVVVNELSSRRAEVLKTVLPEARLFQENAEQLHNILPGDVKPSVILMNPPFSSTAGRMAGSRDTMNGATHIEQALKRLQEGGRLVAIVGNGMAADRPAFKNWWAKIRQDYNVRVNLTVDGSNYAKYGTTFDNQILVIDKTGPTTGTVVTGEVKTLAELPALLEGIRNERKAAQDTDGANPSGQPDAAQQGGDPVPAGQKAAGDRAGGADADPVGSGQRDQSDSGGAGLPGHRQDGSAGGRDGEQVGAEAGGEVSDAPGKPGPAGRGANGRGTGGLGNARGRSGTADRESVPRDGGQQPVTGEVTVESSDQAAATGELSDAIFESYTPQRLSIPGAKAHPGKLVQSAAMAAVLPPSPSYAPNLPKAVIDKGLLSLAQLEAVVYAGQAHSQMLPGGEVRRGFFIGDGCVAAGTRIYNPVTGEHAPIEVLVERGEPHWVLALTERGFEPHLATMTFKKGQAKLYRVTLSDGRTITVTDEHRFLTPQGWATIQDGLQPGHLLAVAHTAPATPSPSGSAYGPRALRKAEDCLADYWTDSRPRGALLPLAADNGLADVPSPAGVPARSRLSSHTDDLAPSPEHSDRHPSSGRLSRSNSSPAASHDPVWPADQGDAVHVPPSAVKRQAAALSRAGTAAPRHSGDAAAHHPVAPASGSSSSDHAAQHHACAADTQSSAPSRRSAAPAPLYASPAGMPARGPESHQAGCSSVACASLDTSCDKHSGWREIAHVEFVRHDDFYDMYVPGPENYVAEGFVNHNTGVGKGREIAGILLDNQRQGRKKAVWLSAKQGLLRDAKRDFAGVSGNPDDILAHNKVKAGDKIDAKSGILFTTYDTLRMGSDVKNNAPGLAGPGTMSAEQLKAAYPKGTPIEWRGRTGTLESWDTRGHKAKINLPNGVQTTVRFDELKVNGNSGWGGIEHAKDDKKLGSKSRLNQIVEWLGKDFDGVIAFDESHKMGNVLERKGKRGKTKPSATALAGVALQEALPKARIVYVSATGATEVHNLAYATRLGLWGEGSAFAKVTDFVGGIEAGGVAAMELVSRDMKAQGSYLARSLSFDGVTYDRLEHPLTPLQTDIYNELARAWQMVLQNVNAALEATMQNKDPKAKSNAVSAFWGNHQRFFSHIITAMQMPTIIEAAQRDLDAGHAVVMQLVNTNQAEQDRQAAKMANDDEAIPEDFDFTPRETLLNYVRHSFPVQQHEEYTDEEGNKATRPVVDSKGNPVFNQEMVAKRDALVKNLEQIRVPDNPLDMILRAFGVNNVAEITGRSRRFVQEQDPKTGGFKVVEQKRPASSVPADADAFMEDKKRVLVFSDAGGTGYSFQSDLGVKNQRRRIHYLVQPGWRANNAVQGFGRTHRSNEANQPHYVLPTTNLKAQKRFISSIARRLDQLGALTKGQRETGGQGLFAATDNLESQHAADAVQAFFVDMYNGTANLNFNETTAALGLTGLIDESTGALIYGKLPDVPKFLNRLMSLETDRQDVVFDEFFRRLEEVIERAKANGTFDAGMETLRADKVTKLRDEVVYEDKRTGASTRYVELELTHPTHFNSFAQAQSEAARWGDKFLGFFRNERTGKVFALMRTGTSTDAKTGNVVSRGAQLRTTGGYRYGDEVDKILKGARGEKTVKKTVVPMLYSPPGSEVLTETFTNANGKEVTVSSNRLADLLIQRGLERVEQTILAGPSGSERDAFMRLLDKMRPHLVAQKETERQVPAFVRLTPEAARPEWEAEVAATPTTYTSKTHLLTGMLLPIWDRLPGDPRVVRTQTADGERLLGRVVSERNLDQTLKNLGVGSNLSKVAPATVIQRLMNGERGILANGWLLQKVRVSNDSRIEISGQSLAYNRAERELLTNNGAFVERINWQERVFIPTGEQGVKLLEKLLEYKPLVELGKPAENQNEEEDAEFSRGQSDVGMQRADVQNVVAPIVKGWLNAPKVTVVQSVADLPFKAPADTRGATYQGQVWMVADNLGHAGEVQFVLAHEALGHLGLQALLGKEALTKELNRLRLINPELAKAARVQAATFGYDLNLATEEALADLAGSGKTINGWQKFAALVQKALRQLGLDRVADWMEGKTQAETMALLARAKEAVEGSRAARTFGNEQAARFSDGMQSPWFSQLARQIEKLPQKSATALQWAETIMGSGFAQKGVKQDEIYWTGVLDYLEGRNGAKVTKAELLDYLAENGVRVTETMRASPSEEDIQELLDDEAGEGMTYEEARDYLRLNENSTTFGAYTLPGGENYRELLLTLPEKSYETSPELERLQREMDAIGELTSPDMFEQWDRLSDAKYQEINRLMKEERENNFRSSHWPEKNVLAHVRFNDRVDGEGLRVLHVEELQSDWGQNGKRDGFRDPRVAEAKRSFAQWMKDNPTTSAAVWREQNPDLVGLIDNPNALPQAPFVGKTEAWLNLALKRMLAYAAEHGYDRVSFVTGQQAVERFNLSAQVKAVEVERAVSGPGYSVNVTLLDGEPHLTAATNDKDLVNLLGKELASKVVDKLKTDPLGTARFEGDNLNLGGHGMRTFYDKIVPNAVNNLLKGVGGGKMGQIELGQRDRLMAEAEQARAAGLVEGAREIEDEAKRQPGIQPAFDITDAMREKVKGGLPLFSRHIEDTGPLPAPSDEASLRLSRATPQQLARQVGDTLRSNTVTKVGRTLSHYRSVGLQFLGRLQLTEIYGKLFPQGDRPNMLQFYSELAAFMDAEKTEGGSKADGIVDRWARLKRADELARLMHDATRQEIDPSKPYVTGDSYKHWKALSERYLALKKAEPDAIKIFHEAADMYQTHYLNVRQAVKDRIDRTLTAHPTRASLLRRLETEFFGRGIKGVYFPLARFGDYVIQVRFVGKNPQPGQSVVREAVVFAETLNQAEDERKRLLAEYPASKGYQVMPVTKRAEFNAARDSVSRGFLKKLYAALDEAGLNDPSLQDTINQLYLSSLPDLSWAKSGIHRTGMPGYSQDARRAFAHHMFHGVSYLAKLNYSDQLSEVLEGMQKYANERATDPEYDHVKAQQVIDEMTKRHDNYLNPKGSTLSTKLTSFGFVWFLGASPASALTNLLQTPTVALPLLGGRFGYTKATSALIQASQEAMKGHNDMSKILKGDEKRAYEEWLRIGLVDLTMVHDLVGVASGRDNQLRGNMRKVMKVASFMFHHAERFNRQATALAAYRLARKDGMNHDEAFRASVEMTKASHFDYAASNRPRFMQGPAAQVIFLFKQYSQNLIYTFARNAKLSFQGDKQAQRTLAGLLVSHAIAAGIIGLPLVTTLLAAASLIGGSDDDPWDAEVALRRLLADVFGETAGQVLSHGITRPTPFDMSGRVGADHLIFPDIQEGLQGERSFDAFLAGLLGPVVGIGANWARALQQWGRGDTARAIETALPSVAKGPWRSIRYAEEDGAKDRNGIVVADDITLAEHGASWLGFSNGRVREAQEAKAAVYERDQALQRRRQQLMDAYARKRIKHEDAGDEMAAIREFNRAHPNRVIAGLHLMNSVRSRMKHNLQAKQGLYLPAKRAKDARQAGDFADGED